MTLRNPTTVDGKAEAKCTGRKDSDRATEAALQASEKLAINESRSPIVRPVFAPRFVILPLKWASEPMPLSRKALPFDHPEWQNLLIPLAVLPNHSLVVWIVVVQITNLTTLNHFAVLAALVTQHHRNWLASGSGFQLN